MERSILLIKSKKFLDSIQPFLKSKSLENFQKLAFFQIGEIKSEDIQVLCIWHRGKAKITFDMQKPELTSNPRRQMSHQAGEERRANMASHLGRCLCILIAVSPSDQRNGRSEKHESRSEFSHVLLVEKQHWSGDKAAPTRNLIFHRPDE